MRTESQHLVEACRADFAARRALLLAAGAAIFTPRRASAQAAAAQQSIPVLEVRAPNGKRNVIVPGSRAPLPSLRHPGYEAFGGIRQCITDTHRERGYRSRFAQRHPSAAQRAPWAETLTEDEVQTLAGRMLCGAPLDFPPSAADEFLQIILTRSHPYPAWDVAGQECRGRAIVSRTRHVLSLAEDRGLSIAGMEQAADLEARVARLPERLVTDMLKRSLTPDAAGRARRLATALSKGAWDDALEVFGDQAPDASAARLLRRTLISDRNAAWMPRLENDLANGDALVVVDIAHLGGDQGLIRLLTAKGFQVTRISVPADQA